MTNKIIYKKFILIIFTISIICDGCKEAPPKKQFYSYQLVEKPINSISTSLMNNTVIIMQDSLTPLLIEYTKGFFIIVDIKKDTILRVIKLPYTINMFNSISVFDSSNFAFFADSSFYIYKNHQFAKKDIQVFNDGYIPLPYNNIVYYPNQNIIASAVLTYKQKTPKPKSYDYDFINLYNIKTNKSEIIPFHYPVQYHETKLSIPKIAFTRYDNDIIVNFSLDEAIYKINILSKKVEKIIIKSQFSDLKATFPAKGTKQEKLDALLKMSSFQDGYDVAFFNARTNNYFRIYKPSLPEKDGRGDYLTSVNAGCHIVRYDMNKKETFEYKLPNGVYYSGGTWILNKFDNSLIYKKILQHDKNNEIWNYYIHNISFFEF